MDINFNYSHVTASESLEDFTREKINKLKDHYEFIISAEVFFIKGNSSANDKGCIAEIQLSLPGPRLFSGADEENYNMAISKAVEEIRRQLKKRKEKMKSY